MSLRWRLHETNARHVNLLFVNVENDLYEASKALLGWENEVDLFNQYVSRLHPTSTFNFAEQLNDDKS